MSKHQEILAYLEELPVGKRVSVRSISNRLGVSDGTAYRAIKEAVPSLTPSLFEILRSLPLKRRYKTKPDFCATF